MERAEGIEPSSSVWKTEVLTITQRPRVTFIYGLSRAACKPDLRIIVP